MTTLLAFETATEACSVALWLDGEVRERHGTAPRQHTALALPWADELLAEAGLAKSQLDGIAVGRGPGAFTGVRLAIALAQGVALALDRPVLPVSTLAALAMQAEGKDGEAILAIIDARMGEFYVGEFVCDADGLVAAVSEERLLSSEAVAIDPSKSWRGVGSGFAAADGILRQRLAAGLTCCDPAALPHAGAVARLAARAYARGEAIAADRLEPAYLRDKVALTIKEQRDARR